MENYIDIEETLKNMSEEGISSKKDSPIKGGTMIILGIVLCILGTAEIELPDCIIMAFIVFGIGLFIYGVILFLMNLHSQHYVYTPTGKRLKKHCIYIQSGQRYEIAQILKNQLFERLSNITKEQTSSTRIIAYTSSNEEFCIIQTQEFSQDEFIPSSDPVVVKGEKAGVICSYLAK